MGGRAEAEVLRRRLGAQLLAGPPAPSPLAATRRLLAIQGQDPRGFRLAVRARSEPVTLAALERALDDERSLVVCTLGRGTLHLVAAEDLPWLHALTTPQLATSSARRLAEEGVSPAQADRAMELVGRWLGEDGPLAREELRGRLQRSGIPVAGQAFIHLVFLACLRRVAVRGPSVGREQALVRWDDWLGPPPAVDRDRALAELGRRYLAGHGPAGERDLARWAGVPLRDARAALTAIAGELGERPDSLLELRAQAGGRAPRLPAPKLLGRFEPLLLGWEDRALVTRGHGEALISGGVFRGFGLVRGTVGAGWRLDGTRVVIDALEPLTAAEQRALERDGERVRHYLGLD